MKKLAILSSLSVVLTGLAGSAYAQQNPFLNQYYNTFSSYVAPTTGNELLDILRSIAGYLIVGGGILAGIAIIISGVLYMTAGSNQTRVGAAKAFFKNGIIGALILFAAGIIVNTIILLGTNWRAFFS